MVVRRALSVRGRRTIARAACEGAFVKVGYRWKDVCARFSFALRKCRDQQTLGRCRGDGSGFSAVAEDKGADARARKHLW